MLIGGSGPGLCPGEGPARAALAVILVREFRQVLVLEPVGYCSTPDSTLLVAAVIRAHSCGSARYRSSATVRTL